MTWTKLSDDFSDECWTLSDGAFRLLVEMLNYSNRKLLDCRIPKDEMRLFAKRPDAIGELVSGGWVRDGETVWEIGFHSLYQPSRTLVQKQRDRNARNGAKGGRPKKNPDGNPHGIMQGSGNPVANPDGNPPGRDGTGLNTGTDLEEVKSRVPSFESPVDPSTGEAFDDPWMGDAIESPFESYVDEFGRRGKRRRAS